MIRMPVIPASVLPFQPERIICRIVSTTPVESGIASYFLLLELTGPGYAQGSRVSTFDVPGAGTASGQGTFPAGINLLGVISGYYIDAGNV